MDDQNDSEDTKLCTYRQTKKKQIQKKNMDKRLGSI